MRKLHRSFLKRWAALRPIKHVKREGISYELDVTELIDCDIYLGCWEPDTHQTIERYITPGMTVLEIGANIGAHTLKLAKLTGGSGHVHSVEPTEYAMQKLQRNVELNPDLSNRISLHQHLFSDCPQSCLTENLKSSWSRGNRKEREDEHVSLPCYTVDSFVAAHAIGPVGFLKMDVDGYDLKVLQGAPKTLSQDKPVVLVEICNWALKKHGQTGHDLHAYMTELGYRGFHSCKRNAPLTRQCIDAIPPHGSINSLFFHQSAAECPSH